jgi:hypothetical protein
MKTEFRFRKIGQKYDLYMCFLNYTQFQDESQDHSGIYVLASEANERIKVLEDALKLTQFSFDNRYCPVCAGWNMSKNGSTEMVHTKDCVVGKALEVKP